MIFENSFKLQSPYGSCSFERIFKNVSLTVLSLIALDRIHTNAFAYSPTSSITSV